MVFEFNEVGNKYEIRQGDEFCYSTQDVHDAVFNLLWTIHREALKDAPGRVRIHSGCGELLGKRFIVAGDKGAGKTTLMMRLLFSGFRVISDELLLLKDGEALPFPRRFHIKQESLHLLPEIDELLDSIPYNMTTYGHRMYSFSPNDAGFEWNIDEGKIDFIFYLEPNHGGESRLELCPKVDMVKNLMPMSFISEKEDHKKISELCSVVDQADCYVLHNGDLEGAVSSIQKKMSVI